jgi:hypothetical protein
MWIFQIGSVYLNNTTGAAARGGSPLYAHSTPISVGEGYSPNVARPNVLYQGGQPLSNGAKPTIVSYGVVEETIPITIDGADADHLAQTLQVIKRELSRASRGRPIIWRARPHGASNELYAEVIAGYVQERATDNALSAQEGWPQIEADIVLTRGPFFGAAALIELINEAAHTNDGTLLPLGHIHGDMIYEGSPLTITLGKPSSQSASSVILATVDDCLSATINESKSTSSTTGINYTTSSALDVTALRRRPDLSVRVLARFTTLTAPAKAQGRATIQTSAGTILWRGSWTSLGSNTTAQLVDLGDAPLDMLRTPLPGALGVTVTISLRSIDGTSVTATLATIQALLCYDYCVIAGAGLSAGQSYHLFGAQNLSGGGWLPLIPEQALMVDDATGNLIGTALVQGQLPRAFADASLYVTWLDTGRAHTATDTAAVTVEHAPLWRTLRGIT